MMKTLISGSAYKKPESCFYVLTSKKTEKVNNLSWMYKRGVENWVNCCPPN